MWQWRDASKTVQVQNVKFHISRYREALKEVLGFFILWLVNAYLPGVHLSVAFLSSKFPKLILLSLKKIRDARVVR